MTRHPTGFRGAATALLMLVGAVAAAATLGTWGFWALQTIVPTVPTYLVLVLAAAALVPVLAAVLGRFPFLAAWYYFLPALVFLLVFTVYPIFLTVYLAFTDYSGTRSGQANRLTQTEVVAAEGRTLTLAEPVAAALRCGDACVGLRAELAAGAERAKVAIAGADGVTLVVAEHPPFDPDRVSIVADFGFVGFRNFATILERASRSLVPVFTWNVVFATLTVVLVALAGVVLAMLLSDRGLRFRGFYRTALIVSWAIPGVISIQMWQALLNHQFGAVNRLLGLLGVYPIPWLQDPMWAKAGIILVNVWLGFPFMMVAALGILATIPDELYEAARIDGASPLQAVREITLPLLYAPMLPVLLTSFAFNFNNFNVIYLLTGGGPAQEGRLATAQATDILISWAYKTAFSTAGQTAYGLGAAISLLIFFVTIAISFLNFRITGVLKEVGP